MNTHLRIKNLEIIYNNNKKNLTAVKNVSFNVKENEFLCLIGPSGCGKTTILNAIAGFIKPSKGKVLLNGMHIIKPIKNIGIVFQNHALFPWKTVKENIELGPKINDVSKKEIDRIANHYLELTGLTKFKGYYPHELSEGMRQRAAIARTLANNPEVILMDEPFSSLDAQLRVKMQEQLLKIWQSRRKSIVLVTHDIDEALVLSDRILVMTKSPGRIKKEVISKLPRKRPYKLTTESKYIKLKKELIKLLV